MRKVVRDFGAVTLFALAAVVMLQGTAAAQQMVVGAMPQAGEPQPLAAEPAAVAYASDCDCGCSQDACRGGRCCRRQGCYARTLAKWAEIGAFNCSCRGSYKFPVPPQYTYHWPGMYSQRTMTQYASPYRFPALKPPPVRESEPPAGLNVEAAPRRITTVSNANRY